MHYEHASGIIISIPFLVAWMLIPAITWRISLPDKSKTVDLSEKQKLFLNKLARKTWSFFETFVVAGDNWLPPDNYQESPVERIAHRTSPTNIGLSLLANLTAFDFGYIPMQILLIRISNTLQTLQGMTRYSGHFYNWYDTQTLQPLHPNYVSTVDSGNMAGHLITLKQGLMQLADKPVISNQFVNGLKTTLEILKEKMGSKKGTGPFEKLILSLEENGIHSVRKLYNDLQNLLEEAEKLTGIFSEDSDAAWWADALASQVREAFNDTYESCPFLSVSNFPDRFKFLEEKLFSLLTLQELASLEISLIPKVHSLSDEELTPEEKIWLENFRKLIIETCRRAKERFLHIHLLTRFCDEFADIQFDFLYDKSQRLLSIGYNVTDHRRDNGFYDLLASESRLTVFLGIAQGKLPQDSWFALGRQLTNPGTSPILVSWSGSMFEYLMPVLVMPGFENTLLDQTNKSVVQKQIEYGKKRNVPWGVSESGYNLVDVNLNYQYHAFGVPGLGLKRGLGEDLVIAPYASVMALTVLPEQAIGNIQDMERRDLAENMECMKRLIIRQAALPEGKLLQS